MPKDAEAAFREEIFRLVSAGSHDFSDETIHRRDCLRVIFSCLLALGMPYFDGSLNRQIAFEGARC